jgi:hypothetical protein
MEKLMYLSSEIIHVTCNDVSGAPPAASTHICTPVTKKIHGSETSFSTRMYGARFQKPVIFIVTAMKI